MAPCPQENKSGPTSRPASDAIANKDCFDDQYGHLPVQPDDKSRVWGANSFAALPTFKGKLRADVAQLRGRRLPTVSNMEECANSGVLLWVSDPDVPVTVPGVLPNDVFDGGESASPSIMKNAEILGKMFAPRFVVCSLDPSASAQFVDNARKYAGGYALEAGFRRRASRLGVPNARSGFFVPDVPKNQTPPEWLVYSAIQSFRLPKDQQVQPYRFAECAPTPYSLRGSLEGGGFVYQFAARAAALILLLASVVLAPTACYRNRAMLTEAITRPFEVAQFAYVAVGGIAWYAARLGV